MTDYLTLDPANFEEVTEPAVKLRPLAHISRLTHCIEIARWHGRELERRRYPNTPHNFARYLALRDAIEKTQAIPF